MISMGLLGRLFVFFSLLFIFGNAFMMAVMAPVSYHSELGMAAGLCFTLFSLSVAIKGTLTSRWTILFLTAGASFTGAARLFRTHQSLDPAIHVDSSFTALVTGGSKGIGLAAAKQLHEMGVKVIVVSRSPPPHPFQTDWIQADLSVLSAADDVAAEFRKRHKTLDLVILNAGVTTAGRLTPDGLPFINAVNFVVQARLMDRLMPLLRLETEGKARVVIVSSAGNLMASSSSVLAPLSVDHFQQGYSVTKAWQVMYAKGMAARHPSIHFSSLHPGAIKSKIGYGAYKTADEASLAMYGTDRLWFVAPTAATVLGLVVEHLFEDVAVGGERVLWALLDKRVCSGCYVHNFGQINEYVHGLIHNETAINDLISNLQEYL